MAEPPILTLADVRLTFGGDALFEDVGLAVHPGERIALVGRNGSGKSTLMKLMAGLVLPDAGTRFVQPGLSVGYMAQDPDFAGFDTLGAFAGQALAAGEEWRVGMAMEGVKLDPDATLWETLTGDSPGGRNDQVMVRGKPRHVVGYLLSLIHI